MEKRQRRRIVKRHASHKFTSPPHRAYSKKRDKEQSRRRWLFCWWATGLWNGRESLAVTCSVVTRKPPK